jgi:hypothetical protein
MRSLIIDHVTDNPYDELRYAWHRVPDDEYSKGSSLKGRAICVWKVCYHTGAIVLKPIYYFAMSKLATLCVKIEADSIESFTDRTTTRIDSGRNYAFTAMVAPLGQIIQLFKATLGILYPGFYFGENEFNVYFNQLVEIAEEVNCEPALIDLLKQGPAIIARTQQFGQSNSYYDSLFKQDLSLICQKLSDAQLPEDEIVAILTMFDTLPSDPHPEGSGIYACAPGLARLFERICVSLDVPKESEKIIPWFVTQYKVEILQKMVMQIETANERYIYRNDNEDATAKQIEQFFDSAFSVHPQVDPAHFINILIVNIGKEIELPTAVIAKAFQDKSVKMWSMPANEKEELIERFHQMYKEDDLEAFLLEHINSHPDGKPGLKDFRDHMIRVLTEQISAEEIEAYKQEVQDRFAVGKAVADDPIFYVKLHYYLNPDANPSDENASDLNVVGLRAFAATLEQDPFVYFIGDSSASD